MSAREQWEYAVHRINNVNESIAEKLPAFGDEGWELVTLYPQPPHTYLIFKRRKEK